MKNKNNISYNPIGVNKKNSFQERSHIINNLNMDYQTTDPSSSNIQDIFKKQKKLNDDLATLSTNLNLNNDPNENTISYTTSNKNNFNQILTGSKTSKNKVDLNPSSKGIQNNNVNIIPVERQKDKLDELINKFNNLYSSENENKEDNYYTLRNINMNNRRNENTNINNSLNNISSDKINSRLLYKKYHNKINTSDNLINKSSDAVNYNNKRNNNYQKRIISNHLKKNKTDLIPNNDSNYYLNRNMILNKPRTSTQSMNKIKAKINTSNQISNNKFNPIQDKKLINDYYSNTNIDNDNSEISKVN